MKKQDYLIFFVLVALLFAWPGIYKKFLAPPPVSGVEDVVAEPAAEMPERTEQMIAPGASVTEIAPAAAPSPVVDVIEETVEATSIVLSNESVRLTVSSRGAAVMDAVLNSYREELKADSGPVTLDFSERPALTYAGLPGLTETSNFTVESDESPARVVLSRAAGNGLRLRREIAVGEQYMVIVRDTFVNESGASVDLGQHTIRTGPIGQAASHSDMVGMINMGVDALPPAGGVENWGSRIPKEFKSQRDEGNLTKLPVEIMFRPTRNPADWVAAKNKYFVQILMPDGDGADWYEIFARRDIGPGELSGGRVKEAVVREVAADLGFNSQTLGAGESYTRSYEYYVGPKNYKILSSLSHARDGAMGFEESAYLDFIVVPAAKILLRLLNFLHDHVFANYGVAIILLTIIVRVIFWPVTHKGTESMRRMAAVQPLMAEIREKYKDNPTKMQQAMMALYKEHKINPLGGCLPMLVQIPVFFALFVVLRIAIELRFADFLWITDLSAPERIFEFGFAIPLLGWDALNILPLLMTATMIIQQKMTPTAGDPAQQKIMMVMMPAMMLFFLYNFASGLALYWTTQNVLMIVQQMLYLQRKKKQEAAKA